jgi:replication initiation and membrane attachment protein DnaB
MVAGEWARDHVKTREDAIAETKKKKDSDYRRKQSVPKYMLEEQQKEETAGTDTDINEVKEMLKRMGNV